MTASTYEPTHIRPWVELINYQGDSFDGYYIAAMRFFKCTPVERSNYDYILEHLEDTGADDDQVIDVMFSDDSYLCRHYILVRKDATKALKMADMFAERVIRKGSLDPEMEETIDRAAVMRKWGKSAIRHRVAHCREAGVSIFAARKSYFPFGVAGAESLYAMYSEK